MGRYRIIMRREFLRGVSHYAVNPETLTTNADWRAVCRLPREGLPKTPGAGNTTEPRGQRGGGGVRTGRAPFPSDPPGRHTPSHGDPATEDLTLVFHPRLDTPCQHRDTLVTNFPKRKRSDDDKSVFCSCLPFLNRTLGSTKYSHLRPRSARRSAGQVWSRPAFQSPCCWPPGPGPRSPCD